MVNLFRSSNNKPNRYLKRSLITSGKLCPMLTIKLAGLNVHTNVEL